MNDWRASTTSDDEINVDTIALLQNEIARLEAEIRDRDDARITDDLTATWEVNHGQDVVEPLHLLINELTFELAAKEETIALLLEQTRFYEDAAAVQRTEWDELQRWVDDIEHRTASNDGGESRHLAQIEAEKHRFEGLTNQAVAARSDWDLQRRGLEQEIHHLRSLASQTPTNVSAAAPAVLEDENRKLRERLHELESSTPTTPEVETVRKKLAETLARFDSSEVAHRRAGDEWSREKAQLTAALSAAQGQVAREALLAPAGKPMESDATSEAVEADERIRAFRQHLQELHRREAEERTNRGGLSSRLSKLWHHGAAK